VGTQDIEADLSTLRQIGERNRVDPITLAIAESIAKQEGDRSYGVRSIQVANQEQAARVLFTSIRNNVKRWEEQGRPGDFIEFMNHKGGPVGKGWAEDEAWHVGVKSILQRDAPADIYEQAKQRYGLP